MKTFNARFSALSGSPPQAPEKSFVHRFLIENYHFIKHNGKENPKYVFGWKYQETEGRGTALGIPLIPCPQTYRKLFSVVRYFGIFQSASLAKLAAFSHRIVDIKFIFKPAEISLHVNLYERFRFCSYCPWRFRKCYGTIFDFLLEVWESFMSKLTKNPKLLGEYCWVNPVATADKQIGYKNCAHSAENAMSCIIRVPKTSKQANTIQINDRICCFWFFVTFSFFVTVAS